MSKDYTLVGSQTMVREMHEIAGHPIANRPTLMTELRMTQRADYIKSELVELFQAIEAGDFAQFVDALGDIKYFVDGTFVEAGVNGKIVTARIHEANLSKLWPGGMTDEQIVDHLATHELTVDEVYFEPTPIPGKAICKRRDNHKWVKGPDYAEADFSDMAIEAAKNAAASAA